MSAWRIHESEPLLGVWVTERMGMRATLHNPNRSYPAVDTLSYPLRQSSKGTAGFGQAVVMIFADCGTIESDAENHFCTNHTTALQPRLIHHKEQLGVVLCTIMRISSVLWDPLVYMASMCPFHLTLIGTYGHFVYFTCYVQLWMVYVTCVSSKFMYGQTGLSESPRSSGTEMTSHTRRYCRFFCRWLPVGRRVLQPASRGR